MSRHKQGSSYRSYDRTSTIAPPLYVYLSLQTNIPIFKVKESSVRRRYSDFEWLKKELERDSKVCLKVMPHQYIRRIQDTCGVGEILNIIGILVVGDVA